jgi:hypothetical protein
MQLVQKADDRLTKQLTNPETSDSILQAWFQLKQEDLSQAPQRNAKLVGEIVERVKRKLGDEGASVTVQPNLGTFTVAAKPKFLTEIMHEPEILQARATNVSLDLIAPVEKHYVKFPSKRPPRARAATTKGRTL